jgi:hypothetical protein
VGRYSSAQRPPGTACERPGARSHAWAAGPLSSCAGAPAHAASSAGIHVPTACSMRAGLSHVQCARCTPSKQLAWRSPAPSPASSHASPEVQRLRCKLPYTSLPRPTPITPCATRPGSRSALHPAAVAGGGEANGTAQREGGLLASRCGILARGHWLRRRGAKQRLQMREFQKASRRGILARQEIGSLLPPVLAPAGTRYRL